MLTLFHKLYQHLCHEDEQQSWLCVAIRSVSAKLANRMLRCVCRCRLVFTATITNAFNKTVKGQDNDSMTAASTKKT